MSAPIRFMAPAAFIALALASAASAWEIPLTAEEYRGVAGPRRITCGIPLLPGQAKELKELRLLLRDADGKATPVPAQFRELARWWRGDKSLRWVLVDCAAEVGAGGKLSFVLTNEGPAGPAPKDALTVAQDDASITVSTGPAKFVINRKKFNFLERAIVDLDGDGKLADDENLLAASPDCGTVLEDTYGRKYFGADGTASVEVVEAGPMRVCVRARGLNPARDGKGYSPGMYGHDVFMNFYAGSAEVFADVIVTNNPPKSIGSPTFEDASLVLRLAGGAAAFRLVGDRDQTSEGTLAAGESVCLYQDSNGADSWAKCPGFGKMTSPGWTPLETKITSFRGYKVWKRAAGKEEELSSGDKARGLMVAENDRGGVVVHTKHFWQQFPKAAEVFADGTVRVGLFPRECLVPHYLEDTSAKGHEIVLRFFGAKAAGAAARPDPEAVAGPWDSRVYLRPAIEHIGATGALADLGPFTPPTQDLEKKPDTRTVADGARMFTTDMLYGNAYGWQVYGDRWRSNGGHGKRGARQPISEDNYLFRWYVTNLPEWLWAGENRSRHFRDVRCYRVDGQDAFGFQDWAEFRKANRNEDWTNRPQPKGEEYDKYRQGYWWRTDWLFPNPEHTTLDLLYDRYCLMGDIRCLENMRIAAAHGGYFSGRGGTPLKGSWPWRANGWGWRTLFRYWELTGDEAAFKCLGDVIKTQAGYIEKLDPLHSYRDANAKDKVDWWFTNIYFRAAAMTALHTGDEQALGICKALAASKEKDAGAVPSLFAVLFHLTGEEKYRDLLCENRVKGDKLLRIEGYFTPCDHWLANQPPKKKD